MEVTLLGTRLNGQLIAACLKNHGMIPPMKLVILTLGIEKQLESTVAAFTQVIESLREAYED